MKIGIVGFGNLGQYLVREILEHGAKHNLSIAFVWNRSVDKLKKNVDETLILEDLNDFPSRNANLIVEVSHPNICKEFGGKFLEFSDLFVGSPTTFADKDTNQMLRAAVKKFGRSVFVPSGALWGAGDIQKMSDQNTLKALKVTMKKHPSAFRLTGEIKKLNAEIKDGGSQTLYDGPVRGLCPLAPNNVNTMAAAAIAGHNLGFDGVVGRLISDTSLVHWHIVEVEVTGPGVTGENFSVKTVRRNPAAAGQVTGNATYASFFSSLLRAKNPTPGVHLC